MTSAHDRRWLSARGLEGYAKWQVVSTFDANNNGYHATWSYDRRNKKYYIDRNRGLIYGGWVNLC